MTTELLMTPSGSDTSFDVAAVVMATKHLHDFRTGQAEALELAALRATEYMPAAGKAKIEPHLRGLGAEAADRFAERLYRIASDITGGWHPHVDVERATETLHAVIHEAINAVMEGLYRDACVCRQAAK